MIRQVNYTDFAVTEAPVQIPTLQLSYLTTGRFSNGTNHYFLNCKPEVIVLPNPQSRFEGGIKQRITVPSKLPVTEFALRKMV